MELYEELGKAFEDNSTDCDALGATYEQIVARHAEAVKHFTSAKAGLDSASRIELDHRIQDEYGERIDAARRLIQTAVTQCPRHERIRAAIRALANAGTQ